MKILITGGAGFIGSHLCDRLLDEGHKVVAVDNLLLGRVENIAHLTGRDAFRFCKEDILNYGEMAGIFEAEGFDAVFHLAANSDIAKSHEDPAIDINNTFMTTYNTLSLMNRFSVKEIVFASTSAIYGETRELLTEQFGPLLPVSHYGASKLASEAIISSFVENYEIRAWIARFPNVVGERATHGVIYDFINRLQANQKLLEVLGNGEQYKPYLYVKDLVDALFFVWRNTSDKVNIFNIGVDSRTRVKDIARMVIEEMGLESEIRYSGGDRGWIGDVPEFNYDLSKINSLGWKAKVSSDEAVRKSIRHILGKE